MKKNIIIAVIILVLVGGGVILFFGPPYSYDSFEVDLIGSHEIFEVSIESQGRFKTFEWNDNDNRLGSGEGGTKVDVIYTGDVPIEPGTRIYYDINLGTSSESKFIETGDMSKVDAHIVDVKLDSFIRSYKDDYSVEIWLGDEKYRIELSER